MQSNSIRSPLPRFGESILYCEPSWYQGFATVRISKENTIYKLPKFPFALLSLTCRLRLPLSGPQLKSNSLLSLSFEVVIINLMTLNRCPSLFSIRSASSNCLFRADYASTALLH